MHNGGGDAASLPLTFTGSRYNVTEKAPKRHYRRPGNNVPLRVVMDKSGEGSAALKSLQKVSKIMSDESRRDKPSKSLVRSK
jgi:hypothetical protein